MAALHASNAGDTRNARLHARLVNFRQNGRDDILQDSIDKTRRMISQAACASVDRDGIVLSWNLAAQELFGFPPSEIVGRSIELIIPAHLRAKHWVGFRRFVQTGVSRLPEVTTTPALTKGGALVYVTISITADRNGSGEIGGVTATMKAASR
jgi:PAS domain S-box-containing protein